MLKSQDELTLLNMAAAMVDGVYQDIFEALKPGARENEIVGLATKRALRDGLGLRRGDQRDLGRALQPASRTTSPIGSSGPATRRSSTSSCRSSGYRTCYYRTFSVGRATKPQIAAYKRAREWMDEAIALIKPGVATDKIARAFPKAQEIGFDTEMAAFGLNFCHGIGLGLHERPIISRLNSFDDPMELQAGMMFAVETYCPATDGMSAARIEEEVIVTPSGAQIITLFPADELPVAEPSAEGRRCARRADALLAGRRSSRWVRRMRRTDQDRAHRAAARARSRRPARRHVLGLRALLAGERLADGRAQGRGHPGRQRGQSGHRAGQAPEARGERLSHTSSPA